MDERKVSPPAGPPYPFRLEDTLPFWAGVLVWAALPAGAAIAAVVLAWGWQ
jgi:hypothetical protein